MISLDGRTTLLVFGPQIPSFDNDTFKNLKRMICDDPAGTWMQDAVDDLPTYWDALKTAIPRIGDAIPGESLLRDFKTWIRQPGQDGLAIESFPNMLLTPVVVLTQLGQYWRYLELGLKDNPKQAIDLQSELLDYHHTTARVETLGFCTGLLAALAVSSSGSRDEFKKYGSVAVRLAMLVGAVVDAKEVWNREKGRGPSKSYAAAWRNASQGDRLKSILDRLSSDAYISVHSDESRVTLTVTQQMEAYLLKELQAAGITTAEVALQGRFHDPEDEANQHLAALIELCDNTPGLQFLRASELVFPSYRNTDNGGSFTNSPSSVHSTILHAMLTQQCDWYGAFSAAIRTARKDSHEGPLVLVFGPDRCVPPTMVRGLRPIQFAELDLSKNMSTQISVNALGPASSKEGKGGSMAPKFINSDDIAVVGMSIKVAGADDVDEFWQMLQTGQSQHEEIGPERMMLDTLWREGDKDPARKWYGNFIRDPDAFDHKFFKRSPRESAAMDPQQRLFLQAAYQAVEQSGYFTEIRLSTSEDSRDKRHVGVYLGACSADYEHHAAGYTANAFTATGNLKSFIPGKVSHHFGWTGPSMTFDTACSASAVAIHTACRNILSGECTAALAGGIATMTNFLWFQNLAGASFLSPTGQCKAFDDLADGYCRAEGVACVFLKRMSDAVADGSPILGCISSSAVYQNENCTPLFVPNSPSLSRLFKDVIAQAGLQPRDISVVEAHGTGTPVGDPAEYESIRAAVGGPIRSKPLIIGSVKGHIGHTEGASGVISLIKIIMMMRESYIPPQASFTKMSHHINVNSSDLMEVATSLRSWDDEYKIALINNYGASGSNASLVVTQSPYPTSSKNYLTSSLKTKVDTKPVALPFWIAGLDARSIVSRCGKLKSYLDARIKVDNNVTLADLSYNITRQSNWSLAQGMLFSCRSIMELRDKLTEVASNPLLITANGHKAARPVILCFGGQVSTFVGLDRNLYDNVQLLRHHLDECDAAAQCLGLKSIFPDIFSRSPIPDTERLQLALFAMQYASAKCWMSCGLEDKVTAVVGHSFGELTALCVSGVLSLNDAIKLIAGRARLVRDAWGSDPGAMLAVDADEAVVHQLIAKANQGYAGEHKANIACYNGPHSFTIAGSSEAVDAVEMTIGTDPAFTSIKRKRLTVTNAFHSALVEPLVEKLEQVGKGIIFNKPVIPLERATETASSEPITPTFVADHMRKPVYFNHAVQRLAQAHSSAIWLEAGSSSTITVMASRAIGSGSASSPQHFQALSLTNDKGIDGLTDATLGLWRQGLHVSHWAHHPMQAYDHAALLLPPYQFDKARHWMELKSPIEAIKALLPQTMNVSQQQGQLKDDKPLGLWTFVGYQADLGKKNPRFRINTESNEYKEFVSGHMIAQTAPICPATLEVDMAIEALFSLHPHWSESGLLPIVSGMVNHAPICFDPLRQVWLDLESVDADETLWNWKILSVIRDNTSAKDELLHVEARLQLRSSDDFEFQRSFAQYERLVSHDQCLSILQSSADPKADVLSGRNVYRVFSEIVDYGDLYRGVQRVVGTGDACAGMICKKNKGTTWLDVPLSDSFSQVGGIWVNCMTDIAAGDMYIATGCEISMRSPKASATRTQDGSEQDVWHVLARHHRQSDKLYMTDVFVFDASTGMLVEVMLGIQYAKVAKLSMSKMLTRLTNDESVLKKRASHQPIAATPVQENTQISIAGASSDKAADPGSVASTVKATEKPNPTKSKRPDITESVRELVANVSGVEPGEIILDAEMADVGIDSLMGMEISREVEIVFKCKLDMADLMEATTLKKFVVCISNALYGPEDAEDGADDSDDTNLTSSTNMTRDGWSDSSQGDDTSKLSTPPSGLDDNITKSLTEKVNGTDNSDNLPAESHLSLSQESILEAFGAIKLQSDQHLCDFRLDNIEKEIIAASNRLCAALVAEAFETLGCSLKTAQPGQVLERVPFQPQHHRLIEFLYGFLENTARLVDVDVDSGQISRTHIAAPRKSSDAILQELLAAYPEFVVANKLTAYAGKHLADVLTGNSDGIRVIFGSLEGRELVQALYSEHTFNRMNYTQMRDVINRLTWTLRAQQGQGPLKILEMGAGTGGTTKVLAPFLASLGLPVEYTFTDLSPSMVANARRKWGKEYPFMRFAVHDIEKRLESALQDQHIIIASNAIHATHNLEISLRNVRSALRPDGFLMMLEMTEVVPFVDIIFGLLEGWWLFDDGRDHAIVSTGYWEQKLHAAGFGHVDWTDGRLPENNFQKVIIALASGESRERLPKPMEMRTSPEVVPSSESNIRRSKADALVSQYSTSFATPQLSNITKLQRASASTKAPTVPSRSSVVVVTGATGSLGSHIVASLAESPLVSTVVCMNRRSSTGCEARQLEALTSRGIELSRQALSKLRFIETDTSKPQLGLSDSDFKWLLQNMTHIIHNAWPMSGTRPIGGFEPQFHTLRNLLHLARDTVCYQRTVAEAENFDFKIGFQLVSSIGVVGHAQAARVKEERVDIDAVLPIGYCEAKWVCERILDETLHHFPMLFDAMVVRPGQIAGSRTSGFWNPVEHFAFLVKSAQSLKAWPDFNGILQWVPVNDVAATMVDLLLPSHAQEADASSGLRNSYPYPVYHIDNPVGQPWKEMSPVLADALGIPSDHIIPFREWVKLVRRAPMPMETENPAARLIDFLDLNFERMSCGGLILDTAKAQEHSKTMAGLGPVDGEVAKKYIAGWKSMGFLRG